MAGTTLTTDSDSVLNHRICVAPMMAWTDRHDRFFLRQISRHTLLYTEMITTGALLHGDAQRFLQYNDAEHPLALQLGGCEPDKLARCALLAQEYGYDEVNLNIGCPSDRVQAARFGACLMAEPELVADCISAMKRACDLPVTVKCRTGIDNLDSYAFFERFIETVAAAGCEVFIVHARKAWLSGLSPKQNREVPPLNYNTVYQLKQSHPHLKIVINGGIETLDDAQVHLQHVDGVMLGRAAYKNPYCLAAADQRFFGATTAMPTREEIVQRMIGYIEELLSQGAPLKHVSRHMLGLYQGQYGGRVWRRILSEQGCKADAGIHTLMLALDAVTRPEADIQAA